MDLFKDVLPSILTTKEYVLENEKDYNPYIVNHALSFHIDCIPAVQFLNRYPGLDKKLQYQYLLNTIRPIKRQFQPWVKKEKIQDLECVKEYYGYSNEKAKQALRILSKDDLSFIKKQLDRGGLSRNGQQI